jgi:hypothetical protein
VASLAGLGHVALTSLLGLGIAWFGFQLEERVGSFSWIAGGMLGVFALYYGWRQLSGRGICHHATPGGAHHPSEPCEAFLGVYLSGVQFGWRGFVLLSVILAVATLGGMTLFTWLALLGFDRVRVRSLERLEAGLLALVFGLLAVVVIALDHGHEH